MQLLEIARALQAVPLDLEPRLQGPLAAGGHVESCSIGVNTEAEEDEKEKAKDSDLQRTLGALT